ncbi:hypothetical protein TNCT_440431 [Trichonephila clavata]|uniref:Uncharacterized protein n=1 Tax=Trichonephila clavata TaxID=2740835 RepID=A0A8X6KMC3_TRICU|nr:hypothetical protein TNCT_440431 [Trichonephila clavata]
MKLFCAVLLIGFLGVVSCDMKCMQTKLSQCFATLALRYFRNPICRTMYDKIVTQIRNLESLSVDTKTYANLLTPIIIKLLPSDLALDFKRKTVDENWSLQTLLDFLRKELLSKERAKLINSERKNRRENF